MLKRKVVPFIMCLGIYLLLGTSIGLAEEFQPIFAFHTSLDITVDSYFGFFPDDPPVEIPEGIEDEDELIYWEGLKKEDEDIREKFKLTNPTIPNISQNISIEFYGNPTPDLEVILNLRHQGMWGGDGTSNSLSFPLVLNQAYVNYYTDWAMLTAGKFTYELSPLGLLIGDNLTPREGFMVHTMYKNIWITGVYNRLLMSLYKDYPYVSTFLWDDLVAFRASTYIKDQLVGINFIPTGFYDEKGLTIDFAGKIFGLTTKAEFGLVYPLWLHRDRAGDQVWPGGVLSVNLLEGQDQICTVSIGAFSKGFISNYGSRGSLKSQVKLNPNTGGIDLLYQRGLSKDWVLAVDLFASGYLDSEYQKEVQQNDILRMLELKLTKYLNQSSNVSLSTAYLGDLQFNYGKMALNWQIKY